MSRSTRTIAVVTGSRAEFGLLTPVMRAIDAHRRLTLRVVVAGSHWVSGTWREVGAAGFAIDARVRMQKRGETGRAADVEAIARGVRGFGAAFESLSPDAVLVLGDRIEAFAAATAASIGGRRVVHLHGGDRAEGVADEAMRHAISKLAHVHCPATSQSRKRLIRMGEPEDRVFNTGSPAIDGLVDVAPVGAIDFIVLQHPIGAADAQEYAWMRQTLRAVAAEAEVLGKRERRDTTTIVAAPNLDPGREGVVLAIDESAAIEGDPGHIARPEFLTLLAGAKAIVGNSSAGLIEAAALRVPCVNIGPRQDGRDKPRHVVDCNYGEASVRRAIRRALRLDLRRMRHPYGDGRAGQRIADLPADLPLDTVPIRKQNTY